jgi:serine O-acetyltransferase
MNDKNISADSVTELGASWAIPELVQSLRAARERSEVERAATVAPSRAAINAFVEDLRAVLFPVAFGGAAYDEATIDFFVGQRLDQTLRALHEQVVRALRFASDEPPSIATEIVRAFAAKIPSIRERLEADIAAALRSDPAARGADEVLLCYPGVSAITDYRVANELWRLSVPIVPRVISELAHGRTGIDVHPAASIGESFFIDHGTGVVIGESARIGDRVQLYQGVTLGAKNLAPDQHGVVRRGYERHPILEDDVTVYAGATILGRITIGHHSTIGGNVWLTQSVPPYSSISQARVRHEAFDSGGGIYTAPATGIADDRSG